MTRWSTPTTSSTTGVPESLLERRSGADGRAAERRVQPGRGRARRRRQGAAVRGPLRAARRAPGRRRPVRARLRGQGGAGRRPDRRAVRGRARRRPGRGVATYAGVAADRRPHHRRRRRRQHARLRRARRRRRRGLARARRRRRRPRRRPRRPARRRRRRHHPVAVTGDGTGETQYTTTSTVDSFVAAALGFTGRVVLSLGAGVGPARQARLVGEPPAVRLEGAGAADQGAGRRDERAAAGLRRDPVRGADDRGRAAPHPGPDGAGHQGPGRRPVRLDRSSPRSTRSARSGRSSPSTASTPATSAASRSPASARRPPTRCARSASSPS